MLHICVKKMGIHIWKRFGSRSAFQYLHLPEVYTVGTKAKKKQDVFLKGGSGYIYKQAPEEQKRVDNQRMINVGHSGVWKKFHGGTKDTRSFRWSAKAPEPVRTSFDHFVDNTGHGQTSYVAAREAAAVANQEEMDRRRNEDMTQENAVRLSVRRDNRRRERYTMMLREAKTKFE